MMDGKIAHTVARKPNSEGSTPMYAASVPYKKWVRERVFARGWSQRRVAEEIKKADRSQAISGVAYHQHFGGDEDKLVPTNISFMPALNKALGEEPPPSLVPSEPSGELESLQAQLGKQWPNLSPDIRRAIGLLVGAKTNTTKE